LGKGRVILDQLNWDEGMSYMEPKLTRIVACMLGNLGADLRVPAPAASWTYRPVPLKPNRGLKEWMNWGENDMRRFPVGAITLLDVPFNLPKNGAQVVMLRAEEQMPGLPEAIEAIPVNGAADELCFLQACTYGFDFEVGKTVMTYRLNYADGRHVDIPVKYSAQIFDWQRPTGVLFPGVALAWDGGTPQHAHAYVYLMRVPNPRPGMAIVSLDVISGKCRAVPVLLALSLANREKTAAQKTIAPRAAAGPWRVREPVKAPACSEMIDRWSIIGPFDNPPAADDPVGRGLFIEYPPEKEINLKAEYPGKQGPVRWQMVSTRINDSARSSGAGINFLDYYIDTPNWGVAYAYTRIHAPADQRALFNFGSDDGAKVWLNGKQIVQAHCARGAALSQHKEPILLRKGWNALLVKVEQMSGGWGFLYRIDNEAGKPLDILAYDVSGE
jgi:hypothetical protein